MATVPYLAPGPVSVPPASAIEIYSTCPQSKHYGPAEYYRHVAQVARWSEEAGCRGILVYTDNSLVDPWLASQIILQSTERLAPLVAVQPIYMHPYSAAKMIASLGFFHGRKICLNMLAGGFRNDLLALGDPTPHDERYARTVEYAHIVRQLLESSQGVTFQGRYYTITNLKLAPALPESLWPEFLISGSSPAGLEAARAIGAVAVRYPQPPGEEQGIATADCGVQHGLRIGIIARSDSATAWQVAHKRFPEDRTGQLTHQLAMRTSDSQWHRQLSQRAESDGADDNPYWLGPFHNYSTFCPYLVGSHQRVAEEVASYLKLGFRSFILDIPPCREELEHTSIVFHQAQELACS